MTQPILESFSDVLQSTHYLPCISMILPFEPKMSVEIELRQRLKIAEQKAAKQIREQYPEERAEPVLQKLNQLIAQLDFDTRKKSIALFVSPLFEKVHYLDIPVEEKLVIDETFEIRDLIYSKKASHRYLLVILSAKEAKILLGNSRHFIKISTHSSERNSETIQDISTKIANFSDEQKIKENMLERFIRQIDHQIQQLERSYALPLFLMATPKVIGHFKQLSKHASMLIDSIPGNYEEATEYNLYQIMQPYLENWKKVDQKRILKQLDASLGQKRLVFGINQVWKAAVERKGRLLVVEKDFVYPAELSGTTEAIQPRDETLQHPFYIRDAVDDIIEKVLSTGGDVEFVEPGVLSEYQKIALIEYYT
jgi:hypothetical protein